MQCYKPEEVKGKECSLRPLGIEEKLTLLNEQLEYARENSTFYSYLPETHINSLDELKTITTISARDIIENGHAMICCPAGRIQRMVSMSTSGTTAQAKRIAFTQSDLKNTVEFFHHGMNTLCGAGDTVIIFMPGNAPDGLCDLLSRGLQCFHAEPKIYGIIQDYDDAANTCEKKFCCICRNACTNVQTRTFTP